jgi:hypothetical protein
VSQNGGMKVGRPRKHESLQERIKELFAQGMTVREIAHHVGVSKSSVHRIARGCYGN